MPWGPIRISLVKLSRANQMMGDMSTPPTGGMRRRVGPSTGSVGATAMLNGSFLPLICGAMKQTYQFGRQRTLGSAALRPTPIFVCEIYWSK